MSAPVVLFDVPGPRARRRILVASVITTAVLVAVAAWVIWRFWDKGQFDAKRWKVFTTGDTIGYLRRGLMITFELAIVSMILATSLGLALTLGRVSSRRWVRIPVSGWVQFFRAVPLLVLIVFAYVGLPKYGIRLSGFWCVVAGLTLYNSAALCEIFRAGILSLDRGQTEAAQSIGLRYGQAMRLVILPQSLRRMLPSYVSQLITIFKDTSLGFVVAVEEFLRRAQLTGTFQGGRALLPSLMVAALVYLVVNLSLSSLSRRLEHTGKATASRGGHVPPSPARHASGGGRHPFGRPPA